jgi:hypothetical protein
MFCASSTSCTLASVRIRFHNVFRCRTSMISITGTRLTWLTLGDDVMTPPMNIFGNLPRKYALTIGNVIKSQQCSLCVRRT